MSMAYKFSPDNGVGVAHAEPLQVLSANGAITIGQGTVILSGGSALAITIANPSLDVNGARLHILATGAGAHTVTYTAGFNGSGTSGDVATWTGAAGNGMVIRAYNGVWYTESLRNVALG